MSKKLYSAAKWKDHTRRRQNDELRKVQRREAERKDAEPDIPAPVSARSMRKKHARPFADIRAPSVFSLVENPEDVIRFLLEIEIISRTHHISLDLSDVRTLSTDAVGALLATIQKESIRRDTLIRGNQPEDLAAREKLINTGFFSHVRSIQPMPAVQKGRIAERKSKKVEPQTARDLIHLGTAAIFGEARRCQAAYRVLIESMNNTRNHAAGHRKFEETWWATVYADIERGRVCYTFVDTGVGIFRSVKIGTIRKLYKMVGLRNDADILREILEGTVESSTGQPYRGKGLPAIYGQSNRGSVKSLVIIANDVYGNVAKGEYRLIRNSFHGTLLYWET